MDLAEAVCINKSEIPPDISLLRPRTSVVRLLSPRGTESTVVLTWYSTYCIARGVGKTGGWTGGGGGSPTHPPARLIKIPPSSSQNPGSSARQNLMSKGRKKVPNLSIGSHGTGQEPRHHCGSSLGDTAKVRTGARMVLTS